MRTPNGDKPEWFTIKRAAEYLDVGEQTLYRWMRDGRITYRKVGDSTRFLQQDLDAVVDVFPSDKEVLSPRQFCPYCNHDDLVPGDIRTMGTVSFHPQQTRFWTLKESLVPLEAVMCLRCGGVSLRGDVSKMEALRPEEDLDVTEYEDAVDGAE